MEEAEKILGIEKNMSYEEVLRVSAKSLLHCFQYPVANVEAARVSLCLMLSPHPSLC